MEERLIETVALDNQLTLKILDASRAVAADRWHILLIARVEVPLSQIDFENDTLMNPGMEDLEKIVGDRVVFEQRQERNFVDQAEKKTFLKHLSKSLITTITGYLSHPDFAARLALKEYHSRINKHSMGSVLKYSGRHR